MNTLGKVTIVVGMDEDGHLTFDPEWSDDLGYLEVLAALEATKFEAHKAYADEL